MEKIIKKFKRCSTVECRNKAVQKFNSNVALFMDKSNMSPIDQILKLDKYGKKLSTRPVLKQSDPNILWCLGDNWVRELIAQSIGPSAAGAAISVYEKLGWNYPLSLNPVHSNETTIEEYILRDVSTGKDVAIKLTLVNRSPIKIGSIFRNKRSGIEWEVIDMVEGSVRDFILTNGNMEIIRTIDDIERGFTYEN